MLTYFVGSWVDGNYTWELCRTASNTCYQSGVSQPNQGVGSITSIQFKVVLTFNVCHAKLLEQEVRLYINIEEIPSI